jgi:hypothetical protein
MAGAEKTGSGKGGIVRRMAGWLGVTGLILLIPVVAMQFTDEVKWTASDFVFASVMILGVGFAYELAAFRGNAAYRAAAGVALAAAFFTVWFTGAVGIIGTEGNPANLMFGGVLLIALCGAIIGRFHAIGMAGAMLAAAFVQLFVGVIAFAARWGATDPSWPHDVLSATAFFTALWLISAGLFWMSARAQSPPGAVS